MSVNILFAKIQDNCNIDQYVIHKLTAFFNDSNAAIENYRVVTRLFSPIELPVTSKADFPSVSTERWNQVKKGIACFINEMNTYYEPDDDEKIVEDFVSYLKQDFNQFPKGTVLLRRTTNKATLYYIKTNLQITGDKWITIENPLLVKDIIFDVAISALKWLASNLASGGVGNIGSRMLNQLIGDNSIDPQQLEEDLAKIVRDANTEQTVNEQGGLIQGIVNNFNTYYTSRRNSGASKEELYNWLTTQETTLTQSLGVLSQAQFKEKGLSNYIAGANILICVLQEMALQDPLVTNPQESSNVSVLVDDIKFYITYISDCKSQILKDRIALITGISKYNVCSSAGGQPVCTKAYCYTDNFDGSHHGDFYDDSKSKTSGYDEAKKDRDNLIQNLADQMSWCNDVVNSFGILVQHPLKLN